MIALRPWLCVFGLLIGVAHASSAQRAIAPEARIPGLRKVVVVEVSGRWASTVADSLSERIRTNIDYRRSSHDVSPGIDLRIFDVERMTSRGMLNTSQIRSVAAERGAQAVVEVEAWVSHEADVPYEAVVQRPTKDEEGNTIQEDVTVQCLRREVSVETDLRVSDGEGTLVAAWRFSNTNRSEECDVPWQRRSTQSVRSARDLARASFEGHGLRAARTFLPRWEHFSFNWVMDRVTRPLFRQSGGDPRSVLHDLLDAMELDPYNPRVIYVLGLALELDGRHAEASDVYRLSSKLGADTVYTSSSERARTTRYHEVLLERYYGLTSRPTVRGELEPLIKRAQRAANTERMGSPTSIKGGKNRRHPVFEAPGAREGVLLTVPGGTRVRRVRSEGKFVEVQLPDGLLGWLPSRVVR